jgi:Flp pilus assembly protein TadB
MIKSMPFLLAFFVGLFAASRSRISRGFLIKRRVNQFNSNFPDAIELMVRGLRSGFRSPKRSASWPMKSAARSGSSFAPLPTR